MVTEQADIARVPEILTGIPADQILELQAQLRKVWHHFGWTSTPVIQSASRSVVAWNQKQFVTKDRNLPPLQDDAFHAILQWLSRKMIS